MDKNGMIDLGHEYESMCCEPTSSSKKGEKKKRVDYPTLYIRGTEMPELGEGEFYFIAKGKKVGYRAPVNGDKKDCSCEIAVLAMKPYEDSDSEDGLEGALEKIEKSKES